MASIAISSGHGLKVRGASGYLDEVNEARRVVDRIHTLLTQAGVKCAKFHDDVSTSQSANLNAIVNWHNRQTRDYDISVHFNAYQTTSKPMGTETLYKSSAGNSLAIKLSPKIAAAGTFLDRGPKYRSDLAFLNGTAKPANLIEVCFVDSSVDANLYRQRFEQICIAIAETISGQQVTEPPPVEPPTEPPTEPPEISGDNRVEIVGEAQGDVTVYINGSRVSGHEDCEHVLDLQLTTRGDVVVTINGEEFHDYPAIVEPEPGEPEIPANQTNIICTVFGGKGDPNNSAYSPYDAITDKELGVALPWKFPSARPKVRVINRNNKQEAICTIRDLGPWLTDDDYWTTGKRPLAETCYKNQTPLPRGPNKGKIPNGAGIDVTPAVAKALGFSGKANVDWDFIEENVA